MTQEKPSLKPLTEEETKSVFLLLNKYQRKTELLELIISAYSKVGFGERLFWLLVGAVIMFLCKGYYI